MKILIAYFLFTFTLPFIVSTSEHFIEETVPASCIGAIPPVQYRGKGCGVPAYVNSTEFGDNLGSSGKLTIKQRAWVLWTVRGIKNPDIFDIAEIASPLAPTDASFTTGRGTEPNQFHYTSDEKASLRTNLNFNPTYPNEGPLTSRRFSFQGDIRGVQETEYRQYPIAADGRVSPTTSYYLRRYDPNTGWVILDEHGRQELVRCPKAAIGISVAAHLDKTTHGVSQGYFGYDHFEVLTFVFSKPIGSPIYQR